MVDLSIYFQPISPNQFFDEEQLGSVIQIHQDSFPEMEKKSCALFFVPEYRGMLEGINASQIKNNIFREKLYRLFKARDWDLPIYDLGDLLPGKELKDTYFALAQIVAELVKNDIIPMVIGGSQDLTTAMFIGYEQLEQLINSCCIDSNLDLGEAEEAPTADGFVGSLLLRRPCYLFNHSNIGLQIPFAKPKEVDLFEKLFFDICRLGEFNSDFTKAEPLLRNADIISIDFQSVKAADLNHAYANPNGFRADQICQLAKYAGISDKVTSLGIFNCLDLNEVSADLVAQTIWYFLDGVVSRKGDFPKGDKSDYTRFTVFLEEGNHEIIFYKSNKSARWWMEVPYPPSEFSKFDRHHMVPCNKSDYDDAMKNEMPDLWWKTYQKLG